MFESDDNETAVRLIPLKNLPFSGLRAFQMEPWEEGDPTKPNNVLIGHLGMFDKVSMVGRDKMTGDLVFASSSENEDEIINDLQEFIDFLTVFKEMNG